MSDERKWEQTPMESADTGNTQGGSASQPSQNIDTSTDTGSGSVPPRYAHYQINQNPTPEPAKKAPEKPRKKKEKGMGERFGIVVAFAVVFGLVAGAVFQGVNYISRLYFPEETSNTQVGMAGTVSGNSVTTSAGNSSSSAAGQTGTVASVAESAMPAVVAITSVSIQEIPSFFGSFGFGNYGVQEYSSTGSGSGIIVGENNDELLIAKNNHVVEGATTLSVCFIGKDVVNAEEETQNLASGNGDINVEDAVSAKIKGTDTTNDLAVVAVQKSDIPEDTMEQIKIAQIGDSDQLVVGEQVVAIGNALGYGQSVTSGWVSALNRSVTTDTGTSSELIQTDAAINPGNSGGALLNMNGELIGINSAKYASNTIEGMGYAIPISKAKPILEELMNRTTRDKVDESQAAYLGVTAADLTTEAIQMYNMPTGAFVTDVEPGEAADNAGIQKGDIIVKLDGQQVSDKADLVDKLSYYAAGESITVTIARADNGEYKEQDLEITLGSKPASEN